MFDSLWKDIYLLFRGQLEVSRAEVNLYKQNLNKRDTEHKSVLREGDELLRIADERNQELLKYVDFVTLILIDRLQILSTNFASNVKRILSEFINFYPPWNHLKTIGFLMILGGIEVNKFA